MPVARRDLANAVRVLTMDAIEKANSSHPGAPMAMADIAEVPWNDVLVHSPANPPGRIAIASCSPTGTDPCF